MAIKKSSAKHKDAKTPKHKHELEIKDSRFSKKNLIIFAAVFAAIGGFAVWRALAALPPAVSISVSPANITVGQTTTISWSPHSVDGCTASTDGDNPNGNGIWSGSKSSTDGTHTEPHSNYPAGTYNLHITCSAGLNNEVSDVTVLRVFSPPPSAPTLSLSANPRLIAYNGTSTLTWSSTNATSCVASNGWNGSQPLSGSYPTGHLIATKTYTLTCSGPGGQVTKSVVVGVGPRPHPTVTLIANPSSIPYNGYSFLSWNSTNADSCSASWTASHATSGSQRVGRLTRTTSYTITCTGNGSASDPATVSVGAPPANCPPHCPAPPPPPPPRSLPPAPSPAPSSTPTEEQPAPVEPVIEEEPTDNSTHACTNKNNHLLNLLFGGLVGELISLLKHHCRS